MGKPYYKNLFILLLCCCSCTRVPKHIEPQLSYTIQERYLKQLPSPFSPLSAEEARQDWGKEYLIGQCFARELDFYRAITAFRRAEFLVPKEEALRHMEITYEILLCYYLGRRFEEVDSVFRQSMLKQADASFPAYRELLVILYDTYQQLGNEEKRCQILELLQQIDPQINEGLLLSTLIQRADLSALRCWNATSFLAPCATQLVSCYETKKKSVSTAQWLNALLPGSGYLYLGQRQTAFTAFLVNGLFIAASVQFFRHGYTAAGIITTSFEAGWYFGGIAGAGYEAKFYNERMYERCASPLMNKNGLFPIFMLRYSF